LGLACFVFANNIVIGLFLSDISVLSSIRKTIVEYFTPIGSTKVIWRAQ